MADQKLYFKVANQILELIDSGIFPPGSRLPSERNLALRFDVSRASVREAEISLQAQGRVEIKVGSGAYVLGGSGPLGRGFPKVGPFELTEARSLIESEAAALAASMISDEAIEELSRYIQIMNGTIKNSDLTIEEADRLFHMTIAKATNNAAIIHTIENMWTMRCEAMELQNVYESARRNDNWTLEKEHLDIYEALKARNPSKARKAMRTHFARMIEALLIASEEAAYEEVQKQTSESRSRFLLSAKIDQL